MKRISYLDIAKGILILIVLVHHMPQVVRLLGYSDNFYYNIQNNSYLYKSFFMPAFFVITGMFTSEKDCNPSKIIVQNLKNIILPAFTMGAISNWIKLLAIGCNSPIEYLKIGFSTLITDGGAYWFLAALFLSKTLHCIIILLIKTDYIRVLFYFILFLLGWCMYKTGMTEIWRCQHALMLTPFLYLGYLTKKYDILSNNYILILGTITYCILTIIVRYCNIKYSFITAMIYVPTLSSLVYLIAASISGTSMILAISKFINRNSFLEFYGKHSLLLYGFHISILYIVMKIFSVWFGESIFLSLLTFSISSIAVLITVFIFSKILYLPYICYSMGKWKNKFSNK